MNATDPQNKPLVLLKRQFSAGRKLALVDAIVVCKNTGVDVPAWLVNGLFLHRDAIKTALKPPPQTVQPQGLAATQLGYDGNPWGKEFNCVDPYKFGYQPKIESVPAGSGDAKRVASMAIATRQQLSFDRFPAMWAAYKTTLDETPMVRRHTVIKVAYARWKSELKNDEKAIGEKQFRNIIDAIKHFLKST